MTNYRRVAYELLEAFMEFEHIADGYNTPSDAHARLRMGNAHDRARKAIREAKALIKYDQIRLDDINLMRSITRKANEKHGR